ncbi:MAG: hypothetical protein COA91_08160 [Robiginitomaculum sp.]|nr:MAG: hypothetical protein COA91_08160 [Robiginitomaculum sp.]
MDMSAIAAFTTSLQAATDITKSMLGLKVSNEVQTKIIELQSVRHFYFKTSNCLTANGLFGRVSFGNIEAQNLG